MRTTILIMCVIAVVFFSCLVVSLGRSSSYNQTLTAETLRDYIGTNGLQVCSEKDIMLTDTPGYLEGKALFVSVNCGIDSNPMYVTILGFDSESTRNAAKQRIATTHRNGYGPATVYVYGPYLVLIQGPREIAEQAVLSKIMRAAGATP